MPSGVDFARENSSLQQDGFTKVISVVLYVALEETGRVGETGFMSDAYGLSIGRVRWRQCRIVFEWMALAIPGGVCSPCESFENKPGNRRVVRLDKEVGRTELCRALFLGLECRFFLR